MASGFRGKPSWSSYTGGLSAQAPQRHSRESGTPFLRQTLELTWRPAFAPNRQHNAHHHPGRALFALSGIVMRAPVCNDPVSAQQHFELPCATGRRTYVSAHAHSRGRRFIFPSNPEIHWRNQNKGSRGVASPAPAPAEDGASRARRPAAAVRRDYRQSLRDARNKVRRSFSGGRRSGSHPPSDLRLANDTLFL